jgi:transposase, IS4 family protein
VLPPESKLYANAGYTDYKREDEYFDKRGAELKVQRKKNSKRTDTEDERKEKTRVRKRIETTISDIKKLFPKSIQAVTLTGFLLKINLFILGLQIIKVFN